MNHFRVDFDDGDYLHTGFRGTLAEAQAYYIGTAFETQNYKKHRGVRVEQIH